MGQTPEELRAGIAGTRADMSATVEAITNRADPRNAVRRRVDRGRRRIGSVREAVMGTVDDLGDRASSAGGGLGGAVSAGPDAVRSGTRGNPLAAGLVAFGAGMVISSIIPSSGAERRTAGALEEGAEPVVDHARQAVQELGQRVGDDARAAASDLRGSATDSAGRVREHAASAATDVRDAARDAAQDVRTSS